jgi:2-haloacid dehalogenase
LSRQNSPATPLRALVFDAYGTLFNVHSVITTCEAIFPGKGSALSQLWRSKQLEYSWLRSLIGRYVDFNEITREGLQYACASLGLSYTETALVQLEKAYRTLDLFDDTLPTLQQLRRQQPTVKLAILSNGAAEMLTAVVAHNKLDAMLDVVISVDEIGIFKPDPRVYQLACDRLNLTRDEIGFVSSNGWDAAGAAAFGFTTFWINRAHAPVEALGVTPDRVLNSLAALPALLAT